MHSVRRHMNQLISLVHAQATLVSICISEAWRFRGSPTCHVHSSLPCAVAQLLACANFWADPQLRWRLILCCEVDVATYEQMTQEFQKWEGADSPAGVQLPPQGFAEEGFVDRWVASPLHQSCAVFGLAHRFARLTSYGQGGTWRRIVPVKVQWHQPVLDRMDAFVAVFHLHHNLAQCCAGGRRTTTIWRNAALADVVSLPEK